MIALNLLRFHRNKHFASNPNFTKQKEVLIDKEIEKLIHKGIIVEIEHEKTEFVSPIFIIHKPDEGIKLILNLKRLNEYVKYQHFKMESIRSVLNLVTKNCFMCTVDLKNTSYSVKVKDEFHCHLKFQWKQKLLKFVCFSNGLEDWVHVPESLPKYPKLPHHTFISEVFQLVVLLTIFSLKLPPIHSVKRMLMMLL